MKTITYTAQRQDKTDIILQRGAGKALAGYIPRGSALRAAVVTDSNVAPLYLKAACDSIGGAAEVHSHVIAAGESSKTLETVSELYSFFDGAGITRTDVVIALGGGVTGDVTGFAAASFLRGVRVVQVPTTLLAMTDSAIGGKTGVDLKSGKNRAGAFHQPSQVIIDTDFLATLPKREYSCGMAEVIKYACIKDRVLAEKLMGEPDMEDVIYTCASIKAGVVQRDQFDSGERRLLNFGHTIGHAIENIYNYSVYNHGEAVAAGMCMLRKANMRFGGISAHECDKIEALCKKYGLPISIEADKARLINSIRSDKKLEGDTLKLVVLNSIGQAQTVDCPLNGLGELL